MDRVLPSASTHTYSAKILSLGKGRLPYLAMTAGSNADFPVDLLRTTDMCNAELGRCGATGANAAAVLAEATKVIAAINFIFCCV